jgi:hypothetical protein
MIPTTGDEAPEKTPFVPTIGGQPRKLGVLGMPEIGQLRIWAKAQQPNPIDQVKPHLDGLEATAQRILLDLAVAELRRPLTFGSPEFQEAMQTGEGMREVLHLSLKRAGQAIERADSDAAADAMSIDQAADVLSVAFGS